MNQYVSKSSRLIYSLNFSNEEACLIISFYDKYFIDKEISIFFHDLNYRYIKKTYGVGAVFWALEFYDRNHYIAEISPKDHIGWSIENLEKVLAYIKKIKNEDEEAL